MNICIPTMGNKGLDETIGEHFGRVPTYTIIDSETKAVRVVDNTSEHMGGQGYPAEIIAKMGINTMICGGLGRRAIMMFEEFGIMVYVGAQGTVRDALQAMEEDRLEAATDKSACTQHAYHDSGEHKHSPDGKDNCEH